MKTRYSNFLDVQDWIVLDRKTFYMYNNDETPFIAVKVKIGTLTEEQISFTHTSINKINFDIIRWIPEKEYLALCENRGIIIW